MPAGSRGHGGVDVTDLLEQVGCHVVRHVGVHRALGAASIVHAHDRREEVVGHHHAFRRVLCDVPVPCHDHHDRLADVVDLLAGQRVAGAGRVQGRVRDQQRQRLGDRAALGLVRSEQVVVGVDRDQPVDVERTCRVDVDDPRMRVRAAHERDTERVVSDVVEEVRRAGDEFGVLDPLHRLTEELGRHDGPSARRISAARSTLATMFW